MKPSAFLFAAMLLLAGAELARAALGATEAQCVASYGSEFDQQDNLGFDIVGDKAASFNVKTPQVSYHLKIIFFNGVAAHETYSNADPSLGLTEDQMKAVLALESAGQEWHKGRSVYRTDRSDETSGVEDWLRSDGATARFWLSGKAAVNESGEVEISTRAYAAAQHDLDKQSGSN